MTPAAPTQTHYLPHCAQPITVETGRAPSPPPGKPPLLNRLGEALAAPTTFIIIFITVKLFVMKRLFFISFIITMLSIPVVSQSNQDVYFEIVSGMYNDRIQLSKAGLTVSNTAFSEKMVFTNVDFLPLNELDTTYLYQLQDYLRRTDFFSLPNYVRHAALDHFPESFYIQTSTNLQSIIYSHFYCNLTEIDSLVILTNRLMTKHGLTDTIEGKAPSSETDDTLYRELKCYEKRNFNIYFSDTCDENIEKTHFDTYFDFIFNNHLSYIFQDGVGIIIHYQRQNSQLTKLIPVSDLKRRRYSDFKNYLYDFVCAHRIDTFKSHKSNYLLLQFDGKWLCINDINVKEKQRLHEEIISILPHKYKRFCRKKAAHSAAIPIIDK